MSLSATRRGDYMFLWWLGDHKPGKVHVFGGNGRLIARVSLRTLQPTGILKVDPHVLEMIGELEREGRFETTPPMDFGAAAGFTL